MANKNKDTFEVGRDTETGEFISVEEAESRPKNEAVVHKFKKQRGGGKKRAETEKPATIPENAENAPEGGETAQTGGNLADNVNVAQQPTDISKDANEPPSWVPADFVKPERQISEGELEPAGNHTNEGVAAPENYPNAPAEDANQRLTSPPRVSPEVQTTEAGNELAQIQQTGSVVSIASDQMAENQSEAELRQQK